VNILQVLGANKGENTMMKSNPIKISGIRGDYKDAVQFLINHCQECLSSPVSAMKLIERAENYFEEIIILSSDGYIGATENFLDQTFVVKGIDELRNLKWGKI
jgi:hypothetical protein